MAHQQEQIAYNRGWNVVSDAVAAGYHAPYTNLEDTQEEHVAFRDGFFDAVAYYSAERVAA